MSDKRYVFKKQCGTCSHLIFKDHKHHEGRCSISGCYKNFESLCIYSLNIDREAFEAVTWKGENNGTITEC